MALTSAMTTPFIADPSCGEYLILSDLLVKVTWLEGLTHLTLLDSLEIYYIRLYIYIKASVVGRILIFPM